MKKTSPILNISYKYRKRYNKRLFKYIQYFICPFSVGTTHWQQSKNFSYKMIKFYYNKFCIIWSDVKNRNIIYSFSKKACVCILDEQQGKGKPSEIVDKFRNSARNDLIYKMVMSYQLEI